MVGHGPRIDAARAGVSRGDRALRRRACVRGRVSRCSKNSAAPKKRPRCIGRRSGSRPFLRCRWRSRRFGNRGALSLQRSSAIASVKSRRHASPEFFLSKKPRGSSRLRARLMESCGRGEGTMLAVGLPEEEALALIARHDRTVTISAFNGPRSHHALGSARFA